jgi:hypothetical protein
MSGDGAPAAARNVGSSSITVKPVTSSTPARSRSRITLLVRMLLVRMLLVRMLLVRDADLNAVFRRPAHYRGNRWRWPGMDPLAFGRSRTADPQSGHPDHRQWAGAPGPPAQPATRSRCRAASSSRRTGGHLNPDQEPEPVMRDARWVATGGARRPTATARTARRSGPPLVDPPRAIGRATGIGRRARASAHFPASKRLPRSYQWPVRRGRSRRHTTGAQQAQCQEDEGQRTVVTGGSGHIGVNLVRSLIADGHEVTVVDVREPATADRLGATWARADVRDADRLREVFRGADVVYHRELAHRPRPVQETLTDLYRHFVAVGRVDSAAQAAGNAGLRGGPPVAMSVAE